MNATLLHAVVRVADARTTDGELLSRFAQDRDELAFAELVRRHGPLVWAVCRQLLPHHADAEDAFQATFLALVRSAASIRAGQALPAWLHGVAVRVAAKLKRSAARQRRREERVAVPEANQPVPDAAWSALLAAVHEEVQQLPDAERTAFVLCDLEGVRQPDAAARLGWPLGTLSGRLCKARQRLLEQLARRGIAPGVLALGGLAATVGSVPAAVQNKVFSLSSATAAGISSTVAALVRGLGGGVTMRTKLTLGAFLVAGAIGLTGGAVFLSQADAQDKNVVDEIGALIKGIGQPPAGAADKGGGAKAAGPRGSGAGLGGGGGDGAPPAGSSSGGSGFGAPPMGGGSGFGAPPGATAGGPGMTGMMGAAPIGRMAWEYKFVEIPLDDRREFEKTLVEAGKDGWEYAGAERFSGGRGAGSGDGGIGGAGGSGLSSPQPTPKFVLVFKRSKGGPSGMMGMGGMGMGMPGGAGGISGGGAPGGLGGLMGGSGMGSPSGGGMGGGQSPNEVRVFKLSQVSAEDVAATFKKVFPAANATVAFDKASNSVFVSASAATMKDVVKLIEQLDAKPKPVGPGGTGTGASTGGGGNPFGGGTTGGPPPGGTGSATGTPPPPGMVGGGGAAKPAPVQKLTVIPLKFTTAQDAASVLSRVFPNIDITPDLRTNQLIIRADEATFQELEALLQRLDVNVSKPK